MRRALILLAALLAVGLAALVLTGADDMLLRWAMEEQRDTQNALARALRALRAGDPGAMAAFAALCFAYGFFHAAGPGHGKILIGGYGAARRVGPWRLSGIALLSSLAQALTAILLVAAGLWVLGWSRERMTGLAEDSFAPLSFALVALVGLWLAWRGARALGGGHAHAHARAHAPGPDGLCTTCGHAHAPAPADLERATGWRDTAMLVGAVAVRPCTGALFVLILTAQMGIFATGIAGALAMGLGTASVTVAVAIAAVTLREGALASLPGSAAIARVQPMIELGAGIVIALLAGRLALGVI
ncbi:nickel/cobalt transporter [Rhodophyticola porphyridii]|uniref:Nickel/cobalt efflux system n=1 Tax=Rhodophyticola porphyridii TaxID=1852017 RepID=A0A3L9Y0H9_9RHOB|nr:hypothetical protein [Rhodophyticola porphyridii]RMA41972.1 hypothetical protein D9R08_10880 [Rhodophyticola porphyridii]